jgi:hypothetical protein
LLVENGATMGVSVRLYALSGIFYSFLGWELLVCFLGEELNEALMLQTIFLPFLGDDHIC